MTLCLFVFGKAKVYVSLEADDLNFTKQQSQQRQNSNASDDDGRTRAPPACDAVHRRLHELCVATIAVTDGHATRRNRRSRLRRLRSMGKRRPRGRYRAYRHRRRRGGETGNARISSSWRRLRYAQACKATTRKLCEDDRARDPQQRAGWRHRAGSSYNH